MHLFVNVLIILITWKWADYRSWQKYQATMLFLPLTSLVYSLLSYSSGIFLWDVKPDLFNHAISDLLYVIILLPCTVLLFLSNYPAEPFKKVIYYLKYIFIYSAVEIFLYAVGRFGYSDGWTILHSIFFYFLMFPAIIIHYKKPILAYIVFIFLTVFGVWFFKLPIT